MEQSSNKITELTDMAEQKKNGGGGDGGTGGLYFHSGSASAILDQTLTETASASCS